MLAGDEARRLGAALAAAAKLEGLADNPGPVAKWRQAARGEGGEGQRSGRAGGGGRTAS
jgi:hypothetical protein